MLNKKVEVKNGLSTLFWEDPWIKDKPLCILFRVLYDLCLDKFVSVHQFLSRSAQLQFPRWLPPFLFDSWIRLLNAIYAFPFDNTNDVVS